MTLEKIIYCKKCGIAVPYKTKPPQYCLIHRLKKKKKKSIPIRSKGEAKMQRLLNKILPEAEAIDNGYYSWLLSPKQMPMQLDRYYPGLKLAFEYNGAQHYRYNNWMHGSQSAFEYLKQCDILKNKLLIQRGIQLITIKFDKELSIDYLLKRLEAENILDLLREQTKVYLPR